MEATYEPEGPWIFGKDAKYAGQAAEVLIFQPEGYQHLYLLLKRMDDAVTSGTKLSLLHQHLRWLLASGEGRIVPAACCFCGSKPVIWLPVIADPHYGLKRALDSVACASCRWKITEGFWGCFSAVVRARFSSVLELERPYDRESFLKELRRLHRLPNHLSRLPERAFRFFTEQGSSNPAASASPRVVTSGVRKMSAASNGGNTQLVFQLG